MVTSAIIIFQWLTTIVCKNYYFNLKLSLTFLFSPLLLLLSVPFFPSFLFLWWSCEFLGIVNILLKYGAQLNELHLAYCLKYEKFSVFRYFLKKCCPLTPWSHISEFIHHAVKAQTKYKEWLPSLLLAGFDPLNLLCSSW